MRGPDLLRREALRLYERYQTEVIERYSICPWAKNARLDGRTRVHVVTDSECELASLVPLLARWSAEPSIDVAFVIAPRFEGGLEAFSEWSSVVGRATHGVFVAASFHPDASQAPGLVHFLRQTPDPTVQLVRRAMLERIRSHDPPHYTDIFELDLHALQADKPIRTVAASVLAHNAQLIEREGRATLQQIIDDIRQDRERTYAKLISR